MSWVGRTAKDNRLFVESVLYRFGDFRVIHIRHTRRSNNGVWQRIFEALAADAIGRSRGGLSTKNHATVDAPGNPTGFQLTSGQAHDLDGLDALLPDTPASIVIANKAYFAQQRIIEPLQNPGKGIVIPPKCCRKQAREYDRHLYQARHLIEQFFNKLKQYRSIATRYDNTARYFLGAIHLAAAVTWLN